MTHKGVLFLFSFAASAASADSDGDTDGDAGQEVQHSSITGFRRDTTVSSVKRSYAHRTGIPVEALEFKLRGRKVALFCQSFVGCSGLSALSDVYSRVKCKVVGRSNR